MTVGQEHGGDVGEVSPDPDEEPLQTPEREAGVHEEASSAGLQVCRVARASARKDAKAQNRLPSFVNRRSREPLAPAD